MTNINPFQALINSAFPTLNAPAPVEAEEERGCEYCGCGDTELADDSDPSVGYYNRIVVCAGCGKEIE